MNPESRHAKKSSGKDGLVIQEGFRSFIQVQALQFGKIPL